MKRTVNNFKDRPRIPVGRFAVSCELSTIYKITSLQLKAEDTQEAEDECRLELFLDGQPNIPFCERKSMKKNSTYKVSSDFLHDALFSKQACVKLMEEDMDYRKEGIVKDDRFGEVIIEPKPGKHQKTISGRIVGKYRYVLTWQVEEVHEPMKNFYDDFFEFVMPRRKLLTLENCSQKGFTSECIQQYIDQLCNCSAIYPIMQESNSFCGESAILYMLANRYPKLFVQHAVDLFLKGRIEARHWYQASEKIRNHKGTTGGQRALEWYMMITLSSATRPIDPFILKESVLSDLNEMSYSTFMMQWCRDILLCDESVYFDPCGKDKDVAALALFQKEYDNGSDIFMMVDSDMINNYEIDSKSKVRDHYYRALNSHWVPFLGNYKKEGGTLVFDVWSWGAVKTIRIPEKQFSDYFAKAVIGRRTVKP